MILGGASEKRYQGGSKKNQAANEKLLPDSVYALRDNRIDLPRQNKDA